MLIVFADKVFSVINNDVYGEISGIAVKFPGYPESQVAVCKLGVACPTTAGGSYTEKVVLPVEGNDPTVSARLLDTCRSRLDSRLVTLTSPPLPPANFNCSVEIH